MRATQPGSPRERLLEAFLADPTSARYGYDLMKAAHVASGTLYPQLTRWERKGMLTTEWESPVDGRPPRKLYRLTADGVPAARLELASLRQEATPSRSTRTRPALGGAS